MKWPITATLAALSLCLASTAQAQRQCGPRDQVVQVLSKQYQEGPRAAGMINRMTMMEVYVSAKGTWTILITDSNGMACILAAGAAWGELPPPPKGEPS
jgi:hypothetical protein